MAAHACADTQQQIPALPVGPLDDGHQLRDLAALIGLVAACDCVLDAMRHVIFQHFLLDAPKRGANRRDLRHDVDAVAVLIHHSGQAAHLAFDPVEAFLAGCLDTLAHAVYIPP
jgi:hypothetical protein